MCCLGHCSEQYRMCLRGCGRGSAPLRYRGGDPFGFPQGFYRQFDEFCLSLAAHYYDRVAFFRPRAT